MEENVLAKIFGDDETEGPVFTDETDAADPPLGHSEFRPSRFVIVVESTHVTLSWGHSLADTFPVARETSQSLSEKGPDPLLERTHLYRKTSKNRLSRCQLEIHKGNPSTKGPTPFRIASQFNAAASATSVVPSQSARLAPVALRMSRGQRSPSAAKTRSGVAGRTCQRPREISCLNWSPVHPR